MSVESESSQREAESTRLRFAGSFGKALMDNVFASTHRALFSVAVGAGQSMAEMSQCVV